MEATQGNVRGSPVLISLRGAEGRRRAPAWAGLASVTAQAAGWRAGGLGPGTGCGGRCPAGDELLAPPGGCRPRRRRPSRPCERTWRLQGVRPRPARPAGSCLRPLLGAGCACTRRLGSRSPQEGGEAEGVSPMESLLEAERPHPRGLRAGNAPGDGHLGPPLEGCSP